MDTIVVGQVYKLRPELRTTDFQKLANRYVVTGVTERYVRFEYIDHRGSMYNMPFRYNRYDFNRFMKLSED
jgi:hypothetical protein